MASSIQILRSNTAKERPFPGNLLDGQPALNTNSEEPGLFFKASDGSIVKIGPAAITSDGGPPNAGGVGQLGNTIGELWLDKSVNPPILKVYDGTQWVDAGSGGGGGGGGQVTLLRWTVLATAGQTVLSGADSSSQQLAYTAGFEEVFVNGAFLRRGVDYIATNGLTIAISAPLTLNDEVTVLAWTPIAVGSQIVDADVASNAGITYGKLNLAGSIVNADVSAGAGITYGKLNLAGSIVNADVSANAGITSNKLSFTQAEGGALTRTIENKLRDTVSVKDFGAAGDGITDDTAAVTAALNSERGIYFPVGDYLIISKIIVTNKAVAMRGEHFTQSRLVFSGSSAGIEVINTGFQDRKTVFIESLYFWKSTQNTADFAIKVRGNDKFIFPQVVLHNVSIHGFEGPGLGMWTGGVWLDKTSMSEITGVSVNGIAAFTQTGFKLTGESYDVRFYNCNAFSLQTGWDISGTGEGVLLTSCEAVDVLYGVYKKHTPPESNGEPWLAVYHGHWNCVKGCIYIDNGLQCVISGNLFYGFVVPGNPAFPPPVPAWTGIEIVGGTSQDIIISNNIFSTINHDGPSRVGIKVTSGGRVTVSSNTFGSPAGPAMNIASEFTANSYDCYLTGSVYGPAVTTKYLNVGSGNIMNELETGWGGWTGSSNRITVYNTATITLSQLAGRVAELQATLARHGLINP